ncbi:Hachiman antiphage defense system protein HamA, partial [Enterococcus faecalis]|uniref:Hachiman antiphage defense system protein HamA n=1 Tax=Enterococcus faecalis TaxID=1351 RepID=UPI003984C602
MYKKGESIDDKIDNKYLRRGEFGELFLHSILKYLFNTNPLIAKIHFKDSFGHAVHGFDSIHINTDSMTLWLGESK